MYSRSQEKNCNDAEAGQKRANKCRSPTKSSGPHQDGTRSTSRTRHTGNRKTSGKGSGGQGHMSRSFPPNRLAIGELPRRLFHESAASTVASLISPYRESPWPRSRSARRPNSGVSRVILKHDENGKLIVCRSPEERKSKPEELVLDRYNLTSCPILDGEDDLQRVSYQENLITKIDNLNHLSKLVVLDLSNNCIEHITSLDNLMALKVLVLKRNRIKNITGLDGLKELEVLDLSHNQIGTISNLNHLTKLQHLSLAHNNLHEIKNLTELTPLMELNLSHNQITTVAEVDHLPKLKKLLLNHNRLERTEDISCVYQAVSLVELSFEGCSVTQKFQYRLTILSQLPNLRYLDSKRVFEEEKRLANAVMRKEELKRQETLKLAKLKTARESAVANAMGEWRSCLGTAEQTQKTSVIQKPGLVVPCLIPCATPGSSPCYQQSFDEDDDEFLFGNGDSRLSPGPAELKGQFNKFLRCHSPKRYGKGTAKLKRQPRIQSFQKISRSVDITSDDTVLSELSYLAEMENKNLCLYGLGAVLEAIHYSWPKETACNITFLNFHYLMFDDIVPLLPKLFMKFPLVRHISLHCTNISCLPQLSALSQFSAIDSLTIEEEGNSVIFQKLWRLFAVYRFGQILNNVNGSPVTSVERVMADKVFCSLGYTVSSVLPKYRLSSFFSDPRIKRALRREHGYLPNMVSGDSEVQLPRKSVVNAVLQYKPAQSALALKKDKVDPEASKHIVHRAFVNVNETLKKQTQLQQLWPALLRKTIAEAIKNCYNMKKFMKSSMIRIMEEK